MGNLVSKPGSPTSTTCRNANEAAIMNEKPRQSGRANLPLRTQTANLQESATAQTSLPKRKPSTKSPFQSRKRRRSFPSKTNNENREDRISSISKAAEKFNKISLSTPVPTSPDSEASDNCDTSPLVRVLKWKETMLNSRWADRSLGEGGKNPGNSKAPHPKENSAGLHKRGQSKQDHGGKDSVKPAIRTQTQRNSDYRSPAHPKQSLKVELLPKKEGLAQQNQSREKPSAPPPSKPGPSTSIPSPAASGTNIKEAQRSEKESKQVLEEYSQGLQKAQKAVDDQLQELNRAQALMRECITDLFNVKTLPAVAKQIAGEMVLISNKANGNLRELENVAKVQTEQFQNALQGMGTGGFKPSSEQHTRTTHSPGHAMGKNYGETKPQVTSAAQDEQLRKHANKTTSEAGGRKPGLFTQPTSKPLKRQEPTEDGAGLSETNDFGIKKPRLYPTEPSRLHSSKEPLNRQQSSHAPKHAAGTPASHSSGGSKPQLHKQGTSSSLPGKRGADNMLSSSSKQIQPLPDDNRYDGQGTRFGMQLISETVPKRRKMTSAVALPNGHVRFFRKRLQVDQDPDADLMELDEEL